MCNFWLYYKKVLISKQTSKNQNNDLKDLGQIALK